MIKAVKEAFDREGIEIPYPHAVQITQGGSVSLSTKPSRMSGS